MNIYRILDAEINRVSEGFRVIEDIARFSINNKALSSTAKELRHKTRKEISHFNSKFIFNRDAKNDIGLKISQEKKLDTKSSRIELIAANFKRVQESLRSIEETLKIINKPG